MDHQTTTAFQKPRQVETEVMTRYVSFVMEGEVYGVNVLTVQEVLRVGTIADVPGAPSACLGVINLRGQIVPVADLRQLIGLPVIEPNKEQRIVVVDLGEEAVGFLVDKVSEVVRIRDRDIEAAQAVCSWRPAVSGVVQRGSKLFLLLDVERLLEQFSGGLA